MELLGSCVVLKQGIDVKDQVRHCRGAKGTRRWRARDWRGCSDIAGIVVPEKEGGTNSIAFLTESPTDSSDEEKNKSNVYRKRRSRPTTPLSPS